MGFIEVLIIVIVGLVLIGVLCILGIYNKLYFYKNKIVSKYNTLNEEIINICNSAIKVIDVVDKIYGKDKVKDVKEVYKNLVNDEEANERMHKVVGLIKFLNFVKDHIKDNKMLEEYENDIDSYLEKIEYASEFYNNCVDEYNKYKEKWIVYLVFKMFRFKEYNKCNIIEDANRV